METNLVSLVGCYNIKGNILINNLTKLRLMLGVRKQVTPTKSSMFLINKSVKGGDYISSLYPVSTSTGIDTYNFDYQNIKYNLVVNKVECKAEVKRK